MNEDMPGTRVCWSCGHTYPLCEVYFPASPPAKWGFRRHCKRCFHGWDADRWRLYVRRRRAEAKGHKICRLCSEELPGNKMYFPLDGARCRQCITDHTDDDIRRHLRIHRAKRIGAMPCRECGISRMHNQVNYHHTNDGRFTTLCRKCILGYTEEEWKIDHMLYEMGYRRVAVSQRGLYLQDGEIYQNCTQCGTGVPITECPESRNGNGKWDALCPECHRRQVEDSLQKLEHWNAT